VLLFLLLEVVSFRMLIKNTEYQRNVFLSSSNSVAAFFYQAASSITDFFKLRSSNESLSEENTELKNQIVSLKKELEAALPEVSDSLSYKSNIEQEYRFIDAKVINNSTNKVQNYITINKGERDGIRPDMGVINEDGVVGVVATVSDRFSVIIPVLNPKLQIVSKFERSNYTGPVAWAGEDYRYANLLDIARHVDFNLGDSLITSGLTTAFPEGIPVGTVEDFQIKDGDPYYNIKVKLAVNFRTLSHVKVINYLFYFEQKELEERARQ
jgi:rod shape-determining protein MreC